MHPAGEGIPLRSVLVRTISADEKNATHDKARTQKKRKGAFSSE